MKALILSFFIVILGYSLFIDTDKEPKLLVSNQDTTIQSSMATQLPESDVVYFLANKTFCNKRPCPYVTNDSVYFYVNNNLFFSSFCSVPKLF